MTRLILAMLPDEEWLKKRAETKQLGTFEDAWAETRSLAYAVQDVIEEALLSGIAEFVVVLYKGEPRIGVGLASNKLKDRWPEFLEEDVVRLKKIIGTDEEPKWYPDFD
ncbi:unnamed protein product [Somion occarium]|uniref:Uncharacterized protein n=1 Tax=Somion occarium TaxID=3059160 RepID=A0ABP1E0F9_9APHY